MNRSIVTGVSTLFLSAFLVLSCNRAQEPVETGVVMSSAADLAMLQAGNTTDLHIHRYNNTAELIHSLEAGRVDEAIIENPALESPQILSLGLTVGKEAFCVEGVPVVSEPRFAFRPEDSQLCGSFNIFLEQIRTDGTLERIIRRWTTPGPVLEAAPGPSADPGTTAEPLKVGMIYGNIPFCFARDGRVSGIEADILRAFAASLGRTVEFHEYEIIMLQAGLDAGRIDLAAGLLASTSDRDCKVLFSEPYTSFGYSVVTAPASHAAHPGLFKEFHRVFIGESRYMFVVEGLLITLVISFFSLLFGTLAGILIAWRHQVSRRKRFWESFMSLFGKVIHGIPLLVLLLLMYYLVFANAGLPGTAVAIVTFSVYFAYVSAEIFISGVRTVSRGQKEAAASLGFTPYQTFRFITLPQALKRIVPFYESEMTTLIKETSLVGFIAIVDLTRASDVIQSITFNSYYPLILTAAIYFLIIWLAGKGLEKIAAKIRRVL